MATPFVDSSVLAAGYLADEEHGPLVLGSGEVALASELAHTEVSRALAAATRAGRIPRGVLTPLLDELDADTGRRGSIRLIELDGPATLARARELVLAHPLRTLDAVHLAVAEREGRRLAEPDDLVFLTHDDDQRRVARRLGFQTSR